MKGGTMESEVDNEAKSLALVGIGECAASHWWLRNCRNCWKTQQKWAPKCNSAIWTNSHSILRQPEHLKPFEGWTLNIETGKPIERCSKTWVFRWYHDSLCQGATEGVEVAVDDVDATQMSNEWQCWCWWVISQSKRSLIPHESFLKDRSRLL